MVGNTLHLLDCVGDELFHIVRFGEGIFAYAADYTGGGGVRNLCAVMHYGVCFWGWFFECDLSNESGIAYCAWRQRRGLREMGEVEPALPVAKSGADEWVAVGWLCDWILSGVAIEKSVSKREQFQGWKTFKNVV